MSERARGWRWVSTSLRVALALPLAVAMIAPFIYMVATGLPRAGSALQTAVGHFVVNSAIVSLTVVAGRVLKRATAAYAVARLRFCGRDHVLLAYLGRLSVRVI